jgi:hypothetical protein
MFSARGVALNATTASVQLRVLYNNAYLSARLKLRGTNSNFLVLSNLIYCFFIWFVRLLALRPLLAYCASLG